MNSFCTGHWERDPHTSRDGAWQHHLPTPSVWEPSVCHPDNRTVSYLHWLVRESHSLFRLRGGELFDFIAERERLSEEEASHFIKQVWMSIMIIIVGCVITFMSVTKQKCK